MSDTTLYETTATAPAITTTTTTATTQESAIGGDDLNTAHANEKDEENKADHCFELSVVYENNKNRVSTTDNDMKLNKKQEQAHKREESKNKKTKTNLHEILLELSKQGISSYLPWTTTPNITKALPQIQPKATNNNNSTYRTLREALTHAIYISVTSLYNSVGYELNHVENTKQKTHPNYNFFQQRRSTLLYMMDPNFESKTNGMTNLQYLFKRHVMIEPMPFSSSGSLPFVLQRIAEILLHSKRYYTKTHKLCNGLEKLLLLVSSHVVKQKINHPSNLSIQNNGNNALKRPLTIPAPSTAALVPPSTTSTNARIEYVEEQVKYKKLEDSTKARVFCSNTSSSKLPNPTEEHQQQQVEVVDDGSSIDSMMVEQDYSSGGSDCSLNDLN